MAAQRLPLFVVQRQCLKCGYIRPDGLTGQTCPQCGCLLVQRPITLDPRIREPIVTGVACEMADVCPDAGAKCLVAEEVPLKDGLPVRDWLTAPSKRWLYCYSYKRMLGLSFVEALGVYHLRKCPQCGLDLEAALKQNLKMQEGNTH